MSDLSDSYRYGHRFVSRSPLSLRLALSSLESETKSDLSMVYAFFKVASDIASTNSLSIQERELELDLLKYALRTERYSEGDVLLPGLIHVIGKYNLPKKYLYDLVEGLAAEIVSSGSVGLKSLEARGNKLAGATSMACAIILGAKDKATLESARHLGLSIYMVSALCSGHADATSSVVAELARRAHQLQDSSHGLVGGLPSASRRLVRIAREYNRAVLKRIEQKHYSVYNNRIRLSGLEKIIIVLKTR